MRKPVRNTSARQDAETPEIDRLAEAYAPVSLHGVLPLVLDPEGGSLRFARLGEERPEDCLADGDKLPDAQADLFVFRDSGSLAHWRAGILEVSGNTAEVVLPETRWPRAALLVRHDRPARSGSLEEAVPLRLSLGGTPGAQAAAALGRDIRRDWLRIWLNERDEKAFLSAWAAEISALRRIPEADVEGRRPGSEDLSFTLAKESGFRGIGPSFRLSRRQEGGYMASWKIEAVCLDDAAGRRVDEAAAALGACRRGLELNMEIASLSRDNVLRLRDVNDAVCAAARGLEGHRRNQPSI